MSDVKKELANIVNASKRIGNMYRSAGIQTGREYAEAGRKTAQLFNGLYNCYTNENKEDKSSKKE